MGDDRNNPGPEDSKLVSLEQDYEVDYWTDRFAVSRQRLEEAVKAAGHSVKAVERWLIDNPPEET